MPRNECPGDSGAYRHECPGGHLSGGRGGGGGGGGGDNHAYDNVNAISRINGRGEPNDKPPAKRDKELALFMYIGFFV